MKKTLEMTICAGEEDVLGNDENVLVSVTFSNGDSMINMTFGGRDGSSNDCITIEELLSIAAKL